MNRIYETDDGKRKASDPAIEQTSARGCTYHESAEGMADLIQEPSAAARYIQGSEEGPSPVGPSPARQSPSGPSPAGTKSGGRFQSARSFDNVSTDNISSDNLDDESAPMQPDPRIPTGSGYTEEDYFALPDDLRVELIDGVFYAMSSPAKLHQSVSFEIGRQLADCIEQHADPCFLYIAPSDVALGEEKRTIVQPDVYVHCDRDKEKRTGPHRGAPDLAIEVLSPSNPEHDMWRKRELYQRHGVREYWIVNPSGLKVYVFDFEKGGGPEKYTFDDTVPVGISGGSCKVDFRKVHQKIRHLLEQE